MVITSRPACVIRQKIHLHDVIFRDAGFMRNKKGAKLFKKLRPVFMSRSDGRKKCVDYLVWIYILQLGIFNHGQDHFQY